MLVFGKGVKFGSTVTANQNAGCFVSKVEVKADQQWSPLVPLCDSFLGTSNRHRETELQILPGLQIVQKDEDICEG